MLWIFASSDPFLISQACYVIVRQFVGYICTLVVDESSKIFNDLCVRFFLLSVCSTPQENFSSSFLTLTQIDAQQDKTRLCYIYSHIRFVCAWHWAQSEALIFISFRRQKKIGPDLCDKMWRWLHNTCKLNLMRERKRKKPESNCESDLKCVFLAKKREYIDNYISDNGKSSNVSRIFARIDKNPIRCHMFNIDQMKIRIVRSFFPLNTFNCFGWNWIFRLRHGKWAVAVWYGACVI